MGRFAALEVVLCGSLMVTAGCGPGSEKSGGPDDPPAAPQSTAVGSSSAVVEARPTAAPSAAAAVPEARKVQVLASALVNPRALALRDGSVFVAVQGDPKQPGDGVGSILSVTKDGSATTTIAKAQFLPSSIVTDELNVFWATLDASFKVPLAGGSPTQLYKLQGKGGVTLVGIDEKAIFLSIMKGLDDGALLSVQKIGGATTELFSGAPVVNAAASSDYVVACAAAVISVPKKDPSAGRVVKKFVPEGVCDAIAVDETNIFWSVRYELHRASLPGGSAIKTAHVGSPKHLALSGAAVYLAREDSRDSWQIGRVPKTGGAVEVLLDQLPEVSSLAVDDTHVYWVSRSAGTLSRASL